ncbi:MAG: galactose-1-phosphate uridylyltransferase, partial [Leifsonia sp.]
MSSITKREYRLSDGRELLYYDDADTALDPERAPDLREPAPRPATATMRQDPLTGEWVSIAAARQNRVFLPPAELDPLAPASPGNPSEVPSLYDVAVFENKSPSFGPLLEDQNAPDGPEDLTTIGLGRTRTSVGRCEVVCFSPETSGSFGSLTPSRARTVIEAWADRTAALSALPGVRQVFPFENRGEAIGVTLHHPHGQIYAFPFVTPRTAQIQAQAQAYARSGRGNLFDDVVAAEIADGNRLVARNAEWTAFVPAAARWPYEILLFPARRVPDLPSLDDAQRAAFGDLYIDVLGRLGAIFDGPPPYIAAWYQAPAGAGPASREFALHLRVMSVRRAPGKL